MKLMVLAMELLHKKAVHLQIYRWGVFSAMINVPQTMTVMEAYVAHNQDAATVANKASHLRKANDLELLSIQG